MATETGTPARVLLVGKRVRVLDELRAALRAAGMTVHAETDFDRLTTAIDGTSVDILTIGRKFSGSRSERVISALRAQNPDLRVVQALAPIPELVVAQVQEAATTPPPDVRIVGAAAYERGDNSIVLILRRTANIDVSLYRLDPMYRVHRLDAFTGPLSGGRQRLPLGRRVGRGERFLVVRADGETTVHQLG